MEYVRLVDWMMELVHCLYNHDIVPGEADIHFMCIRLSFFVKGRLKCTI